MTYQRDFQYRDKSEKVEAVFAICLELSSESSSDSDSE